MSFNNFQKQPQQPFYQNQNVAPMQQNQFQQSKLGTIPILCCLNMVDNKVLLFQK